MKHFPTLDLAFLLMLGLKLSSLTDISWWWVFTPMIIATCIAVPAGLIDGYLKLKRK